MLFQLTAVSTALSTNYRTTELIKTPLISRAWGRKPTARGTDPARQAKSSGPQPLYQIVVTVWPAYSGIIFYESALLATFCIEYLRGTTYEKRHGTINILYVAFWAFVMNFEIRS